MNYKCVIEVILKLEAISAVSISLSDQITALYCKLYMYVEYTHENGNVMYSSGIFLAETDPAAKLLTMGDQGRIKKIRKIKKINK